MKKKREIVFTLMGDGKFMQVQLTRGFSTLIDAEDFNLISGYSLSVHINPKSSIKYAMAKLKSDKNEWTKTNISRLIMGVTDPELKVDHIDHNGLNNRKYNLRVCSHKENARNTTSRVNSTSKYLGVHKPVGSRRFTAAIRPDNKRIFLGKYLNEHDAAMAYDKAALEHYGDFANLNFP